MLTRYPFADKNAHIKKLKSLLNIGRTKCLKLKKIVAVASLIENTAHSVSLSYKFPTLFASLSLN